MVIQSEKQSWKGKLVNENELSCFVELKGNQIQVLTYFVNKVFQKKTQSYQC